MGGNLQVFRSSHREHKVSESTIVRIKNLLEILQTNPKVNIHQALLSDIPKYENIQSIHDDSGYNLLQRAIGLNHVELVRWLLERRLDVNRSPCSLPLHIACLKGFEECVELLLKHGARIDTDARMCFPQPHSLNCEERGKYKNVICDQVNTKLQNAVCYAIDGDQINVLNILVQKMEDPWMPFRVKKPLLHLACERGAWKCVQQLVITRSDEINLIKDEYYPIHLAILHDLKFLELLIQHGAETTVRTCTQQMTLLHVVLLHARKSADDVLQTLRILLERGCKELINSPDSLGNTPLHALIVRYALEEAKYGYDKWNKWDVLHLVRFLLQAGAKSSINQAGNSALACVFRHIRDWDVCYEILTMLIKEQGDPNIVGRDGSVPLMVCLVPLINKDPMHHFTHTMKVCYLNCIRILLQNGANPNCSYRSTLSPLHVLIFTVSENFTLICDLQKRTNFDFIKNILMLLLQHGLNVNQSSDLILQSCIDMVQNVRTCADILCLYELVLLLLQYGAKVNVNNLYEKFNYLDTTSLGYHHRRPGSVNAGPSVAPDHPPDPTEHLATANQEPTTSANPTNPLNLVAKERNSFRNAKNNLLYYYIMLINKKEFLLADPDQTFIKIINLFYNSMEHRQLYNCLKNLNNIYLTQVPSKHQEGLVAHLKLLYRQPRKLNQCCRLAIYEAVDKKLAQNINNLNLPSLLKEYLLNFE